MSKKHPVIESLLEEISSVIGTPRSVAFKGRTCVMCSGSAATFKNAISEKEYTLSGMCQKCQDEFFDS